MKFTETVVMGAYIVEIEPIHDDRGFFARSWCSTEFAERGLDARFVQENIGFSTKRGTLRGLHFQVSPFEEAKLVRCTRGAVWDVAVDIRPTSASYRRWVAAELTEDERNMLYVPRGCAHGYLTLGANAEIRYLTSEYFEADASRGLRYDDPVLAIRWPAGIEVVSDRDLTWPLLDVEGGAGR